MIHLTVMNTNITASCSDLFPNRIKLQSELAMQVKTTLRSLSMYCHRLQQLQGPWWKAQKTPPDLKRKLVWQISENLISKETVKPDMDCRFPWHLSWMWRTRSTGQADHQHWILCLATHGNKRIHINLYQGKNANKIIKPHYWGL